MLSSFLQKIQNNRTDELLSLQLIEIDNTNPRLKFTCPQYQKQTSKILIKPRRERNYRDNRTKYLRANVCKNQAVSSKRVSEVYGFFFIY